jgi:hypothetical protein
LAKEQLGTGEDLAMAQRNRGLEQSERLSALDLLLGTMHNNGTDIGRTFYWNIYDQHLRDLNEKRRNRGNE